MKKLMVVFIGFSTVLAFADDLRTCVRKLEAAFAAEGWICVVEAIDITGNRIEDFIITYKSSKKPRKIGELLGATSGGIYAVSKVADFKLDMVYVLDGDDQWEAKAGDCIKCYKLADQTQRGLCVIKIWNKVH